jgi:hypothetical protein
MSCHSSSKPPVHDLTPTRQPHYSFILHQPPKGVPASAFSLFLFARGGVSVSKLGAVAKLLSRRFRYELDLLERGLARIAGVDEAGRVIFPTECVTRFWPSAPFGLFPRIPRVQERFNSLTQGQPTRHNAITALSCCRSEGRPLRRTRRSSNVFIRKSESKL